MSDTSRITAGGSPTKLYEDASDDPATIAEDKARADYEAKHPAKSCEVEPDKIPCATQDHDYGALAKTMPKTDAKPADPRAERYAIEDEADAIADRLAKNPLPYAGKKEDQARLAELQKQVSSTPENFSHVPQTSNATRADTKDGVLVRRSGQDGPSLYAGVTGYQKTDGATRIQAASFSGQVGMSSELEVTTGRIVDTGASRTVTIEGPSANFTGGFGRNDDGSLGYHAGASVGLASGQVTKNLDNGGSVTLGISEGAGAGVSIGAKTIENGETAACVQVSALFFTVGACLPVRM